MDGGDLKEVRILLDVSGKRWKYDYVSDKIFSNINVLLFQPQASCYYLAVFFP